MHLFHCWHPVERPRQVSIEREYHGYVTTTTTSLAVRDECCKCKQSRWQERGYDDYGTIDGKVTVIREVS